MIIAILLIAAAFAVSAGMILVAISRANRRASINNPSQPLLIFHHSTAPHVTAPHVTAPHNTTSPSVSNPF